MKSASNAILVDSNILLYAVDPLDIAKQERAADILASIDAVNRVCLSVQCLSEFFNAATRKLPQPLSRPDALARVEELMRTCRILDLSGPALLEGCRGSILHQMSIWDGLIWAVAKLNTIPVILTEDGQHGRVVEGVRYLNPFHPQFDESLIAERR